MKVQSIKEILGGTGDLRARKKGKIQCVETHVWIS